MGLPDQEFEVSTTSAARQRAGGELIHLALVNSPS